MAEKDPYNIRTQYLPEFAYFSVPQVAKILGTSRTNAKEIIYGGVAEYLLDLHRQRNGHPSSTVREFTESFVKRSSFEKFNLPPELEYLHYRDPHTDTEKIALYEHPLGDEIFQTLEGRPVISKRGLDILASTPFADPTPRAINVRARAGRLLPPHRLPRNPGRSSIGWNWQTPEPEASNAIRQWWPVLNKYESVGLPFIVSLGGYVVRQGRILEETINGGLVSFEVDWDDAEIRNIWEGKRIENKQGNIIIYLGE